MYGLKLSARIFALTVGLWACPAFAGPPFMTDDPVPTDTGHWEIYAPIIELEGKGSEFSGAIGSEINYGAAPDVQITVGLPVAYSHEASGMKWGAGDIGASLKYRFFNHDGLSIAVFPGITLPTATNGMGSGKVSAFLPIWVQKDVDQWSFFGGGGYALNPGQGNHDYWRGALAISRQFTPRLLAGIEADRQGADTEGKKGSTRIGMGAIYQLKAPFRLLASGGPVFEDGGGTVGLHGFIALNLYF